MMMNNKKTAGMAAARLPNPKLTLRRLPLPRPSTTSKRMVEMAYWRRKTAQAMKIAAVSLQEAALARREVAAASHENCLLEQRLAALEQYVEQQVQQQLQKKNTPQTN